MKSSSKQSADDTLADPECPEPLVLMWVGWEGGCVLGLKRMRLRWCLIHTS